ncbi:MAG: hypothetical protein OXC68_04895 [Aestuariivita sp.]|nr:hypothetical protein [Aestuariivita sp.]
MTNKERDRAMAQNDKKFSKETVSVILTMIIIGLSIMTFQWNTSSKIDVVNTSLNAKIDILNTSLNAKIDKINGDLTARIDKVNTDLTARIDKVNTDLTARIDKANGDLTARIDKVNTDLTARIDNLGTRMDNLQIQISEVKETNHFGDSILFDINERMSDFDNRLDRLERINLE